MRLIIVVGAVKCIPHTVEFDLKSGEVHALVGENGAGKSTLIKIIAGVLHQDKGRVYINGKEEQLKDSRHARSLGIGAIFQELSLVPTLSVADNVCLGNENVKSGFLLDRKGMTGEIRKLLDAYGIHLDPNETVEHLSPAEQQMTEIVKAISLRPHILIMDEPTAALSERETRILFRIIEELKKNGVGIVYVSHRMNEVLRIADRVAVLRDGVCVEDCSIDNLTLDEIVRLMVGREVSLYESSYRGAGHLDGKKVKLDVRNLSRKKSFSHISFRLHEGEILGIAGLAGSGRSEVMRTIFGINRPDSGEIWIDGAKVRINSVEEAVGRGIAYLPANRKLQGLVMMHTVANNIVLAVLKQFVTGALLKDKGIHAFAMDRIREFDIKPGDPGMTTENLSGGNQQKVCIAKWLSVKPRILIVDEPTLGIDVRTKSEIHRLLRTLSDEGISVIMISSDMPELLAHSDRIMVMNKGRVLDTIYGGEATQEKIMALIMDDIVGNGIMNDGPLYKQAVFDRFNNERTGI